MQKKSIGSWVVHHSNKLDGYIHSPEFKNIKVAGKCGTLLSAITEDKDSSITNTKLEALAASSNIDTTFELPRLLEVLENNHLIERNQNGIEVLGLTNSAVLSQTSDIFKELKPSRLERASLELADLCSDRPQLETKAKEYVSDTYKLSNEESTKLLSNSEEIGFTDFEQLSNENKIYFNGYLFKHESIPKINAVLASLSDAENRKVVEANEYLEKFGCVESKDLEKLLGKDLFEKLLSIGMYELNQVSNDSESVIYVTRPQAFVKFQDPSNTDTFDLAKSLVASITYGINRRSAKDGRIRMVELLMQKLLRGKWVGPAKAIGEDYRILETKKVVKVKREGYGFSMKLLKKEIGEIALKVIQEGDASEKSLDRFPGSPVTNYIPPEQNRSILRKQQQNQNLDLREILNSIRTEN
ncbi:hypothetical protein G3570_03230 [Balneolaceae bacterium YR4-1]|uniref:Uncharacterized protein n=1 Tax=Halalkalibaculum roseum TaxID=2709311 RepID=A0A6M1SKV0_9BACT|nr:hypothetical protein [Halalkalibaculum roseum]NGP75629.1 hypothetical protein [Halalkalibaculum roseum]